MLPAAIETALWILSRCCRVHDSCRAASRHLDVACSAFTYLKSRTSLGARAHFGMRSQITFNLRW